MRPTLTRQSCLCVKYPVLALLHLRPKENLCRISQLNWGCGSRHQRPASLPQSLKCWATKTWEDSWAWWAWSLLDHIWPLLLTAADFFFLHQMPSHRMLITLPPAHARWAQLAQPTSTLAHHLIWPTNSRNDYGAIDTSYPHSCQWMMLILSWNVRKEH